MKEVNGNGSVMTGSHLLNKMVHLEMSILVVSYFKHMSLFCSSRDLMAFSVVFIHLVSHVSSKIESNEFNC